jgi:signal transduction histidine kinase
MFRLLKTSSVQRASRKPVLRVYKLIGINRRLANSPSQPGSTPTNPALLSAPYEQGVIIEVSDTGSGIPVDDLEYIFERFWRGAKRRQTGSGLGLAITKYLVQAHEGEISVGSVQGEGTTFTISLPNRRTQ